MLNIRLSQLRTPEPVSQDPVLVDQDETDFAGKAGPLPEIIRTTEHVSQGQVSGDQDRKGLADKAGPLPEIIRTTEHVSRGPVSGGQDETGLDGKTDDPMPLGEPNTDDPKGFVDKWGRRIKSLFGR